MDIGLFSQGTSGAKPHDQAWFIGGVFVLMALPISIWEILQHLIHYTKPYLQKHIIRILWMVPIYALNAWLGLLIPAFALYMDTCREAYEAYVIYNFLMFLLSYLRIDLGLEDQLLEREAPHLFPFNFILKPWTRGKELKENCKHGILQYTVVRLVTAFLAFIFELAGIYGEGQFVPNCAYPYLVVINNISQFIAMYCLVMFYYAYKEELAPMKPFSKFLCIKAVIFFSFIQGFIIAVLVFTGVIPEAFTAKNGEIKAVATSLQNFLICIEMFLAAIAHIHAFSHIPYIDANVERSSVFDSCWSMFDTSDVYREINNHVRVVGSSVKRKVMRQDQQPDPSTERSRLISPGSDRTSLYSDAASDVSTADSASRRPSDGP